MEGDVVVGESGVENVLTSAGIFGSDRAASPKKDFDKTTVSRRRSGVEYGLREGESKWIHSSFRNRTADAETTMVAKG